jgi:exoribonuclease R
MAAPGSAPDPFCLGLRTRTGRWPFSGRPGYGRAYARGVSRRRVRLPGDAADEAVRLGLARLREELHVPADFPPPVLAEADAAAHREAADAARVDATDVPFVTIDPAGSTDLDQALHLEHRGDGYRVRYAIADVAAWVAPAGAVDTEARSRVVTLYAPDARTPLHPPVLTDGAASLLPDGDRPALLWTIDIDSSGATTATRVERATVRSRAKLAYDEVQRALDAGTADGSLPLLREVGSVLQAAERARGGITLPEPEQVVVRDDGRWRLATRRTLPVEEWNAQLSLLTGRQAAATMLTGRIGVLRTLPPADPRDVERLHRAAAALGVPWDGPDAEVIARLDASIPAHAALLTEATHLLRGAAYVAFDGQPPAATQHAAIAAPYAHATAPLRRLVDRFSGETCLALCAGREVPEWVRTALPTLPGLMAAGDRRSSEYERGYLDLVEAALLAGRVGQTFDGVVVDVREGRGVVQLREPVVRARIDGDHLPLGAAVRVRLTEASPADRAVRFELAAA